MAGRARRIYAGHEQQFDADKPFAFAGFASALGHVERETAGVETTAVRSRCCGEQLAHVIEQAGGLALLRSRSARRWVRCPRSRPPARAPGAAASTPAAPAPSGWTCPSRKCR
ncbi:hypothetical protein G6F22_019933 [Rhizopus arrhizus]|nr:hypothetical protein G6F22_019933 [Rhizopus arrhizus]